MLAELLKKDIKTVEKDIKTFHKWENEEITTNKAIDEFKNNNKINNKINQFQFVKFLNSLGYYRGLQNVEF